MTVIGNRKRNAQADAGSEGVQILHKLEVSQ